MAHRYYSRGSQLLEHARKKRGWQKKELATMIGADPAVVHHWFTGRRRPGRKWAGILREELGIPLAAWDQPAQRAA